MLAATAKIKMKNLFRLTIIFYDSKMSFQLFSTISSEISILMFFKFHILIKLNEIVLMQPYLIKKLVQIIG